jgi:TPR repeat protein
MQKRIKMKKLIAAAIIIIGGANSVLNATTLQEYNQMILDEKDKVTQQMFSCEREALYFKDNGDPQECLRAVKYLMEVKKPNLLLSSTMRTQNKTFKEAKKLYLGEAYYNAGILFDHSEHSPQKAFESYKKGAKYGYVDAELNTGVMYYFGVGVQKDKIEAYKWSLKAAKHGSPNAQKLLDTLCSESPWACQQ